MQPLIEHSTTAVGFRTPVLEPEDDGHGLILLHGWGDSADTWRPLLALLARDLAAEWGAGEPVVLCGNSLGGLVALRIAAAGLPGLAGIVPVARRPAARLPRVTIPSACWGSPSRAKPSRPPSICSTRPCAAGWPTRAGCRRR